ncbi:MAG: hypothetical protein MUC50_12380 [Myxococcota bacterium]|jgi:hypothetical protein|nr:hypothetical protein [Myxococcota bacterium]
MKILLRIKTLTMGGLAAFCVATTALPGCTALNDDENDALVNGGTVENDDRALSTTALTYVSLRRDTRKCMSPVCGGYYVRDINAHSSEQYVSALDFRASNFNQSTIDKVTEASTSELVLRGKLGAVELVHHTRKFHVSEAYRGMPDVTVRAGSVYYKTAVRSPAISCFAAPCPNEVAFKLNSTTTTNFSRFDVVDAAKPHVDQDWLVDRAQVHGALIAGVIVNGTRYPAGYEKVMDASQVFVKLPDAIGPCPARPEPNCDPLASTYIRNADRCVTFNTCADHSRCPSLQPALCAANYTLTSWSTNSTSCIKFACDPTFLVD